MVARSDVSKRPHQRLGAYNFAKHQRGGLKVQKSLIASVLLIALAVPVNAEPTAPPPNMSTGSLANNRSHAECLDYSASVMRVLDMANIKTTRLSVYGFSGDLSFVIRCETDTKTAFFAAAGGDDGDKVEHMLQILMRQFEITKTLRKCDPRHPTPLPLCQ
jgi:hypothetical protein